MRTASETPAIRPSAPEARHSVYARSAVCGSANASTASAAKNTAEPISMIWASSGRPDLI
ncbi:MAG TPA: hypothetical protein VI365_17595 [Trebonia sp.]